VKVSIAKMFKLRWILTVKKWICKKAIYFWFVLWQCVNLVDGVIVTKFRFFQGMWQHYVGEKRKSLIVVLPIISVYSVPNFIQIGQSL